MKCFIRYDIMLRSNQELKSFLDTLINETDKDNLKEALKIILGNVTNGQKINSIYTPNHPAPLFTEYLGISSYDGKQFIAHYKYDERRSRDDYICMYNYLTNLKLSRIIKKIYPSFKASVIRDVSAYIDSKLNSDLVKQVQVLKGKEIIDWYFNSKISTCMTDPTKNGILKLYEINPDKISLVTFSLNARALLFKCNCGTFFMDRIYSINPLYANILIEYVTKNFEQCYIRHKTLEGIAGTDQLYFPKYKVTLDHTLVNKVPYLDSFRYGYLSKSNTKLIISTMPLKTNFLSSKKVLCLDSSSGKYNYRELPKTINCDLCKKEEFSSGIFQITSKGTRYRICRKCFFERCQECLSCGHKILLADNEPSNYIKLVGGRNFICPDCAERESNNKSVRFPNGKLLKCSCCQEWLLYGQNAVVFDEINTDKVYCNSCWNEKIRFEYFPELIKNKYLFRSVIYCKECGREVINHNKLSEIEITDMRGKCYCSICREEENSKKLSEELASYKPLQEPDIIRSVPSFSVEFMRAAFADMQRDSEMVREERGQDNEN